MKKALLAIPLLGITGWAGATMYAGNEARSAYDELLQQLREQQGMQVEPLSYDKSFLSSSVKTVVNNSAATTSMSDDIPMPLRALGSRFVLDHKISHGPVVMSNGLQALAGHITTTIDMDSLEPEFAAAWKLACSCEAPVVLQSDITLQGEYTHVFDAKAIEWRDGQKHLSFGGIHSESGVDADQRAHALGQTGVLDFSAGDEHHLHIDAGSWEMTGREALKNIIVGQAEFKIPSISFSRNGVPAELDTVTLKANSELKAGAINSHVDLGAGSIVVAGNTLTDTHLDVSILGLPAQKTKEVNAGLSMIDTSSDTQHIETLKLLHSLIEPGLGLSYGLRSKHAEGGFAEASASVIFKPTGNTGLKDLATVGDLVNALKADASLKFDRALLERLPPQLSMHPLLGMASTDGDNFSLEANMYRGIAELNGNEMPIQAMAGDTFAQALPSMDMLAMMMAMQE